jgi:allophanate hydrolase subunit 2
VTTAVFDVLDGGLLTTIQDEGRPDWAHFGVPESGAADPWSRAVANLLVGNDPTAAILELTLVGPVLAVRPGVAISIGLAGADLGARIRGGRRLSVGRSHRLMAGEVVEFTGEPADRQAAGARAFLAVPGGIDAPIVLGSRSTCLAAGFGGQDGRPVRSGDLIAAIEGPSGLDRPELVWPEADDPFGWAGPSGPDDSGRDMPAPTILRVIAGQAPGLERLAELDWRVGAATDRVGVRLEADPVPDGIGGEIATQGVPWGTIQVPPDGRPIILGADHQSTGGYRVVGTVISADLPVVGQLRPGATVRLAPTDRASALAALRVQRDALLAGAAALRDAAEWAALIDSAGG